MTFYHRPVITICAVFEFMTELTAPHRVASPLATVSGFLCCCNLLMGAASYSSFLKNGNFNEGSAHWAASGHGGRYTVIDRAGSDGGKILRYLKERGTGSPDENSHFDQILRVRPGAFLTAEVWTRTDGNLQPVLRIADENWQTLAHSAAKKTDRRQKIQLFFNAPENGNIRFQIFGGAMGRMRQTDPGTSSFESAAVRVPTEKESARFSTCRIQFNTSKRIGRVNPGFFGANVLFMVDDDEALSSPDFARRLREMPCGLLRYPGGDMADNYHWQSHTLDDPNWWPRIQGPDTTDTDEFMAFCRSVGAEPIFVVNLESCLVKGDIHGGIREAAEWVKYCNVEHDYGVKYWEIGNETYIYNPGPEHRHKRVAVRAEEYADAYLEFSRAMKSVDSSIKTGAVGPLSIRHFAKLGKTERDSQNWWPEVIKKTREELDFIVVHRYFPGEFGNSPAVDVDVKPLRSVLEKIIPGRHVEIALTEWNLSKHSRSRGGAGSLLIAEAVMGFLHSGVDLACFWPLRFGSGGGWHSRALLDRDNFDPTYNFRVLQVFASNICPDILESSCSNPFVAVLGTADPGQGRVCVFLLNRSREERGITADLVLDPVRMSSAEVTALVTSPSNNWKMREQQVETVRLQEGWRVDLPPCSLTVVKLMTGNP